MYPGIAVLRAGLEEANRELAIFAQTIGKDGAGRASANDYVVNCGVSIFCLRFWGAPCIATCMQMSYDIDTMALMMVQAKMCCTLESESVDAFLY